MSRSLVLAMVFAAFLRHPPLTAQSISGRVIDADDARPIQEAVVIFTSDGGREERSWTSTDGGFLMEVPAGKHQIRIRAFGYQDFESRPFEVGTGKMDLGEISLVARPFGIQGLVAEGEAICRGDPEAMSHAYEVIRSQKDELRTIHRNDQLPGVVYVQHLVLPKKVWQRQNWYYRPDTTLAALDASYPMEERNRLSTEGFAVAVDDSTQVYRAPSAAFFADESFLAENCFQIREDQGRSIVSFAPKSPPNDLVWISGEITVDPEGRVIRVDFVYENLDPFVRRYQLPSFVDWFQEFRAQHLEVLLGPTRYDGANGGTLVFGLVDGIGPMTTEWEIRGVLLKSSGDQISRSQFRLRPRADALVRKGRLAAIRRPGRP